MSTFVPLQPARKIDWTPMHASSAGRPAEPLLPNHTPLLRMVASNGPARSTREELESRLIAADRAIREAEAQTDAVRREAAAATRGRHDAELANAATEARVAAKEALLTAALVALTEARQSVLAEFRDGAAAVVLEAARRIAGDALQADPLLLDGLIAEASEALGGYPTTIRVSPCDVEALAERLPGVKIVADPLITAGCVAEGQTGRYDATLGTAVIALASVFEQWRTR